MNGRERGEPGWGRVVRRLREERGWTQAQLAEKAGVHQSQVSKIEAGLRGKPAFETVERVADALGVGVDYLRGRPLVGLPIKELASAIVEQATARGIHELRRVELFAQLNERAHAANVAEAARLLAAQQAAEDERLERLHAAQQVADQGQEGLATPGTDSNNLKGRRRRIGEPGAAVA